jgi:transposase
MKKASALSRKFAAILPHLDERARRLVAASEARSLGYGGVSEISRASGLSRKAISKGIRELADGLQLPSGRVRRTGAGRKKVTVRDPHLLDAIAYLIEPETRGDPESPLRWTCKSTRAVAEQLCKAGHAVSHVTIAQLLHEQGYSLQSNRKTEEGGDHPDRDAQFRYINSRVKRALALKAPVISVDTKKKELIGNYVNGGQQWLPGKRPKKVNGHDFPHPEVPRAFPYGVYDLGRNTGFVNVGR